MIFCVDISVYLKAAYSFIKTTRTMPKRKVVSESDKEPKKKLKSQTTPASVSKLSFDSPEQCFRALIFPTSLEDFFAKYWGKEPLFVARKDEEYYKDFPQRTKLEEIAKKEHLVYDKDMFINSQAEGNAEKCEPEGRATVKSIQKYLKEKHTMLFDKPHRFHDELYQLLQLLEGYLGCCAYCCLEVHAEDPHTLLQPGYDGKEDFILQIEGKRKWCLYKPIQKLAFLDSEDMSKEDIGEVIHEFVLEPGDMLYFPRGTVYQTHSIPGEVSSHISIQVYEEYTWGHFLSKIINKAINDALKNEQLFREALPINFLSYMGFGKKELSGDMNGTKDKNMDQESMKGKAVVPNTSKVDVEKQKLLKAKLEEILPTLAQYLDPHWGADNFYGKTFMDDRLPPKQDVGKPAETEKPPTDNSLVLLKYPDHIRITLYDPEEEEVYDDDDDDDDENEGDASMEEDVDGEEKDEDSEKKSKKSKKEVKVSKGKDKKENKSQKSKTDSNENGKDEQMASDEELDESFQSKPHIVLHHSLYNKVEFEDEEDVGDEETDNKVKFPIEYCDALLVLHRSRFPVAVHNLPLTSEERVELAVTLWCEGLLAEVEKS